MTDSFFKKGARFWGVVCGGAGGGAFVPPTPRRPPKPNPNKNRPFFKKRICHSRALALETILYL
jgi:hypothetical protein